MLNNSANIINCSIWFQEDLPYPGVDLSKLKPKIGETYPASIAQFIQDTTFEKNYEIVVATNFEMSDDPKERLFYKYKAGD